MSIKKYPEFVTYSGNAVGKRIRREREALGLTIEGLAELTDKSSSYIGLIERGERTPSLGTLREMAASLNIPLDNILSDYDSSPANQGGCSLPRRKLNVYVNKLDDIQIDQLVHIVKAAFFFKAY